jgi:hypothetical protein
MTRIENQKHFAIGELRDSELAHVSGGTSGLIYAVVVGARAGVAASVKPDSKFGAGLASDLNPPPPCN